MLYGLINSLRLTLKYGSDMLPRNALKESEACYHEYMADVFEKVFRGYEPYSIYLDRLEIDLGKLTPQEIPDRLLEALDVELRKYIHSCEYRVSAHKKQSDAEDQTTTVDPKKRIRPIIQDEKNKLEYAADTLSEYLENPVKPWNISFEHFDVAVLVKKAMDYYLSGDYFRFQPLKDMLANNPEAFYRCVHLLRKPDIIRIIRIILKENPEVSCRLFKDIKSEDKVDPTTVWQLIERIILHFPTRQQKQVGIYFLSLLLLDDFCGIAERDRLMMFYHELDQFEGETDGNAEKVSSTEVFSTEKKVRPKWMEAILHSEEQFQQRLFEQAEVDGTLPGKKERIRISNAGLVLLNPWLSVLFDRVGYLNEEKVFRSLRHRLRAVHLLQILTGQSEKHYDHLLYLNKLLCGVPLSFPVSPSFRICKAEKEEVAALLESIPEYWTYLKNTSVQGLQETFINREGTLEKSGNDWIVRVENETVDILLEGLPWNFSVLAFPWNDYIIHVEWKR